MVKYGLGALLVLTGELEISGAQNKAINYPNTDRQIGTQSQFHMNNDHCTIIYRRSTHRVDQGRACDCTPNLSDEVQERTQEADFLGDCKCKCDGGIDVATCTQGSADFC